MSGDQPKPDSALQQDVQIWIEAVIKQDIFVGTTPEAFQAPLKSGVVLCKVMNRIKPGSVKHINDSTIAFKMMENIGNFLEAMRQYGVTTSYLFLTPDLFEGGNIPQVVNGIRALAALSLNNGCCFPTLH